MKHERAHQRGKGDIGGALPTGTGHNTEDSMSKSMPETSRDALKTGYTGMGGIDTKSDAVDKRPGTNNKHSRI